jgi:hypothetical protein
MSEALVGCGREAIVYGNCVNSWQDIQKGDCRREFEQFKNCYRKVLSDLMKKK